MTARTVKKVAHRPSFDAFLSHASQDAKFAEPVHRSLKANGLNPWIDGSDLAFGALLRDALQDAIRKSRALVLLWSKAASRSRWVMAEIFSAFHLDRFVIPCVLDETPLPQFLQGAAYLNRHRDQADIGVKLTRAIEAAPLRANKVAPWVGSRTKIVEGLVNVINKPQMMALLAIDEDFRKAAKANAHIRSALKHAMGLAPLDPMMLGLTGYQCKNDYMFAHWAEIQAGRTPTDPLLHRGERKFFEALCVNPSDVGSVNGLGSILILEHELDAAEFFVRRAIDLTKAVGGDYMAAEHDLKLILRYKGKPAAPS